MSELSRKIISIGGDSLPLDTWDISTSSYLPKEFYELNSLIDVGGIGSEFISVYSQEQYPRNIFFKSDGSMVYLAGPSNIHQYSLSTPWSISSATFVRSLNIGSYETGATDVSFNDTGTEMYVIGTDEDKVLTFELSTAWDISTASYVPKKFYELNSLINSGGFGFEAFSVYSQEQYPRNIFFKSDGSMVYLAGPSKIHQYSLSTPWSISSATFVRSLNIGSYETGATDVSFNDTGTEMYVIGTDEDKVLTFELTTAWDISTASYSPQDAWDLDTVISNGGTTSISVSSNRESMYIRESDGLKLYVIGSGIVSEYDLSEAYDITTASFVQSFSVTDLELAPTGVSFNDTGTEMYIIGTDEDKIITYELTTAWNISTASYVPKKFYELNSLINSGYPGSEAFSVWSQEQNPRNIFFKPDGSMVYLAGPSNIHQYSLSTPWSISSASWVRSLNIGSYETGATDVSFNPDGTEMYIIGTDEDKIITYELTTAWNISTASYVPKKFYELNSLINSGYPGSEAFSVWSQEQNPRNIFFKPDGSMVYLAGPSNIHQYSLSTPWSISSATFVRSLNIGSYETGATDVSFNDTGTEMYVIGTSSDSINTFELSTAWDVSTATFKSSFDISNKETNPKGLTFKPDGTKAYIIGTTSDSVHEYSLSTPWDTSTLTYQRSKSISAQEVNPSGVRFTDDGSRMFVIGLMSSTIYEYTLSTPWNVSTASYLRLFNFPFNSDHYLQGFSFNDDGSILYVVEWDTGATSLKRIQQWNLGGVDISPQELNPKGLTFKPDGTKAYIIGISSDSVHEYSLSTPFDTSTLVYVRSKSISAQEGNSSGVRFSQDGSRMFVIGLMSRTIYEYTLSTPWNVSTASYLRLFNFPFNSDHYLQGFSFNDDGSILYVVEWDTGATSLKRIQQWNLGGVDISPQEINPKEIVFKPDGTKMYIVGGSSVHEYNLSTPFDVSNLTHVSSFSAQTSINGIYFRADGAKAYITAGSSVYEYDLATPWSTTSASMIFIKSFSVGNTPQGVWFNPSGTIMNILDNNRIEQWDLGGINISNKETSPSGLTFKPDGTKAYIIGTTSDSVHEYNLSTPWDTSTLTYQRSTSINAQEGTSSGVRFSQDGSRMFVIGLMSRTIYEYTLSTPWNVSTASYLRNFYFSNLPSDHYLQGFSFNDTGSILYIVEYDTASSLERIQQWNLGGVDISPQEINPSGLTFKPDGTKAYIIGTSSDSVHEYNLSTPFDTSTLVYVRSKSISAQEGNSSGVRFSQDGSRMFVIGLMSRTIYEYTLSTPWNVSTASYIRLFTFSNLPNDHYLQGFSFNDTGSILYIVEYDTARSLERIQQWNLGGVDISPQEINPKELTFKPDGTKMYIVGGSSVHEYSLSTPFDVSNLTHVSSFSAQTSINGIYFRSDGAKAYITAGSSVYEYELDTPWSTASTSMNFIKSFSVGNTPQGVWFNPSGTVMNILDNNRIEQWDLGGIDISPQEINPKGLTFKPDGTKAYIIGISSDSVHEYSLSTPFDTSTLVYVRSKSISAQEGNSSGVRFSQDGSRMFVIGLMSRTIYEYTLSTPWNVSTASYLRNFYFSNLPSDHYLQGFSFNDTGSILYIVEYDTASSLERIQQWNLGGVDISPQELNPKGLTFKPDGTKAYIIGISSDSVHEYSLSTPFDTSTLVYVRSKSISAQEGNSSGVRFSQDGSRMFVIGLMSRTIYEYTLSTPWNVSTASYLRNFYFSNLPSDHYLQGFSFNDTGSILYIVEYDTARSLERIQQWNLGGVDISPQELNPKELTFKPDGTKMYIVGGSSVHEYNLSTPFDVSNLTHVSSFSAQTSINGIYFRSDGAKAYITAGSSVYEYNLSTPWSTASTSMTFVKSFSVGNTPQGVWFNPSGTVMNILDNNRIEQWDLGGIDISPQEINPKGLTFKPDGTKAYIIGISSDSVHEYSLSTPFDTSTLVYVRSKSISAQEGNSSGVRFSQDGSRMFVIGLMSRTIYEYTLSTPWNVSTASYIRLFTFSNLPSDHYLQGFSFNDTGSILYIVEYDTARSLERIQQWNLSTPWNISSLSFFTAFTVYSQEQYPRNIFFKSDGSMVYLAGPTKIHQYSLSTPWSISTATFVRSLNIGSYETGATDVSFNLDGTEMYVIGTDEDKVLTFELNTAWDISTASYSPRAAWDLDTVISNGGTTSISVSSNRESMYIRESDGLKLYVIGSGIVSEYDLSEAYDITTAVFVQSFSVTDLETAPTGVSFNDTGTEMYVLGTDEDKIITYELSTAWDISTSSYLPKKFYELNSLIDVGGIGSEFISVYSQEQYPRNIFFKSDGSMVYLAGPTKIHQYSLSTPWSISTASWIRSLDISSYETGATDVSFNDTGTEMYVLGTDEDKVLTFELSTAWNISTASYVPKKFYELNSLIDSGGIGYEYISVYSQEQNPRNIFFKSDGSMVYLAGPTKIHQYSLSTPWSISTATFVRSLDISSYETGATDVSFNDTGTEMYVLGTDEDKVLTFELTTAWDVSTASYSPRAAWDLDTVINNSGTTNISVSSNRESMYIRESDGLKLYVIGSGVVSEYNLLSAYDLNTAVFVQSFSVTDFESAPTGVSFNDTGTEMYVLGTDEDKIITYRLGTYD